MAIKTIENIDFIQRHFHKSTHYSQVASQDDKDKSQSPKTSKQLESQ